MKKVFHLLAWLALLLGAPAIPQTQSFSGKLTLPDGTPVNGTLSIGLRGSTFKNICSTPFQVVPATQSNFSIINGVIQGQNTAQFVSQDCLTPRLPYYVSVVDTSKTLLFQDNWYLPRVAGAKIDVGLMQAERMGSSPISVALPVGIVSTPSGSQSVTQLAGTSFTFYGTVNFEGNTIFANVPSFAQILATQVLINGITTSSFPLDVQGIIDASQGFAVAGSGGTLGQCLVSNGTSFVPGTCSPPFPNIWNQNVTINGTGFPSRSTVDFVGAFTGTDDSTNSITHVALSETGNGNYIVTTGLPMSGYGCAQGDGMGGIGLTSFPCPSVSPPTQNVVTGSRSFSTIYRNTGAGALLIAVSAQSGASGSNLVAYSGADTGASTAVAEQTRIPAADSDAAQPVELFFIVPPGYYYKVLQSGGSLIIYWTEWTV